MATGLGRKSLLGWFRGRTFFIGLTVLVAAVLFAACGNDPQPAAPGQQGVDSASVNTENPETAAAGEPAASPAPAPTESQRRCADQPLRQPRRPVHAPQQQWTGMQGRRRRYPSPSARRTVRRARICDRRRHTVAGPV